MAQGQIKKGFFFYFGLFVLLLISVFFVCLVIMMFNPGQTLLWMKYFTGNEKFLVSKTTDTQTTIDWANVGSLKINCGYAKVSVQRNSEFNEDGLYIINEAKGFAGAKSVAEFDYNVYYEGNALVVDIVEPNGFLFLSKNIEVILHATVEGSTNFQNLKLEVNTTDGDIDLGGTRWNQGEEVRLSSIKASSTKGDVCINEKMNTSSLTAFSLSSNEGKLYSLKEITYDGSKTGKGFTANCDVTLKTIKGEISYDAISAGASEVSIDCKKGSFSADWVSVSSLNVRCVQGNYKIGKVYGNLDFENSEDTIIAPNIVVDYVSGNFDLSTNDTNIQAEPDIDIGEVGGTVFVLADRGTVNIMKADGRIDILGEKSLAVDIKVAESNSQDKSIIINSGSIRIGFLGEVSGSTLLESKAGKIVVNVTSVASFTSNAFLNDLEGTTRVDGSKIFVSHGLIEGETKNPLQVRGSSASSGSMQIKTNSTINYNLVDKADLE